MVSLSDTISEPVIARSLFCSLSAWQLNSHLGSLHHQSSLCSVCSLSCLLLLLSPLFSKAGHLESYLSF